MNPTRNFPWTCRNQGHVPVLGYSFRLERQTSRLRRQARPRHGVPVGGELDDLDEGILTQARCGQDVRFSFDLLRSGS